MRTIRGNTIILKDPYYVDKSSDREIGVMTIY